MPLYDKFELLTFFVDKVCTGMKFVLVPKKAQKKEDFFQSSKNLSRIQSHGFSYFLFYVAI